jgi:hypothetical protein
MRKRYALILLLAPLLIAAKPVSTISGFHFSTQSIEIQQPVEQQTPGWLLPCPLDLPLCRNVQSLWVTNPTGMPWDVDDFIDRLGTGPLDSGATLTDPLSYTADCDGAQCGPYRFVVVRASLPSSSVRLSVDITPGQSGGVDSYTAAPPTWNAATKKWDYLLCQKTPSYPYGDPRLLPILGSNGGTGVPTSVTLTVTNAGKALRSAVVTWGLDSITSGVCPAS